MMQEFIQAINDSFKRDMQGVHTAIPGKIVSIDTSTMLATVLPVVKYKKPNGETMDFPQIYGVPIVIPQSSAQTATIAFPIKPDDSCLLIIAEQALDYWMYEQETATDLKFDLTNAICIPGLFPKGSDVLREACSSNAIIIKNKSCHVTVNSGGVTIGGNLTVNGNVTVNGEIKATGNVVGAGVSLSGHRHNTSDGTSSTPI